MATVVPGNVADKVLLPVGELATTCKALAVRAVQAVCSAVRSLLLRR